MHVLSGEHPSHSISWRSRLLPKLRTSKQRPPPKPPNPQILDIGIQQLHLVTPCSTNFLHPKLETPVSGPAVPPVTDLTLDSSPSSSILRGNAIGAVTDAMAMTFNDFYQGVLEEDKLPLTKMMKRASQSPVTTTSSSLTLSSKKPTTPGFTNSGVYFQHHLHVVFAE